MSPSRHRSSPALSPSTLIAPLALIGLVLILPLMMGNRSPETLSLSSLVMVAGAILALGLTLLSPDRARFATPPGLGWWLVLALVSLPTALQLWPSTGLAALFGPYPEALWQHPSFTPERWSPDPAASRRAWAVFMALFVIAWISSRLSRMERNWLLLAVAAMACFQAVYGLFSQFTGAQTVLGIWPRHSTTWVQGSFSNRNLFSAYLALTWVLAVCVWWIRDMPLLGRLPTELKLTGSVIAGALIAAAIFSSASRLGSAAGLVAALAAVVLLARLRGRIQGVALLPAVLVVVAAFLISVWFGLEPLAERLGQPTGEDYRSTAFLLMFREFPPMWWLHGVGLGAFQAVFPLIQTEEVSGWWDYAHSDLIQWQLEMGLAGTLALLVVLTALWRHRSLSLSRLPLYAGLIALALVATGDFSWHIPGTQVVLAIFVGLLCRRSDRQPRRVDSRPSAGDERKRLRKRRRKRSSAVETEM